MAWIIPLARGGAKLNAFMNSDLTYKQSKQRAADLLNTNEILQIVQGLTREDQKEFVDKLDQTYPTVDSRNVKLLSTFGEVCKASERFPTSVDLSTQLKKRGNVAVASGGLADIWRGERDNKQVAIKSFRIYAPDNVKVAKESLWKRVPIWRKLSHENILPFHGIDTRQFHLGLVYDWGRCGNINQHIASNPGVSRSSLLFGVAKGLQYLHSLDLPHGDLKGANVIIDRDGRARLTEYGLAPINSDPSFTVAATPGAVGVSRWLAPEIITPSLKGSAMPVTESKAADVFSFAMLAVEVFTGKVPFEELRNEAVVFRISRGGRPEKPRNARAVGLTTEMWKLLETCWQQDPKKRPTIEDVVRKWRKFVDRENDGNGMAIERPRIPTPGTRRGRTRPAATPPQPTHEPVRGRTRLESVHPRTMSEAVQSRTRPEATRPGTRPDVPQRRTRPDAAQQRTRPEAFQLGTSLMSETVRPEAPSTTLRPVPGRKKKWFFGLF